MKTILATTSSFGSASPEAAERVKKEGFSLQTNPYGRKLTELELIELLDTYKPVGLLAGTEPVTDKVLAGASEYLSVVSRIGVGWDNVDHDKANELGIPVFRTEGILDQPVAELTLSMMLNALRHVSRHDRDIRAGVWNKQMGSLFAGKTVGIIGFGAIGRRVAGLCEAFGAKVIFTDMCTIAECGYDQCELKELLRNSDIVTVHASGCDCLLGSAELSYCKPGAIIINTARGE